MTKQVKFTSLLLLVTSITFAQQSVVNTSKSNVKDRAIIDTAKKPVTTTEQAKPQSIVITTRSNIKDRAIIDTAKKPVTTTEQAKPQSIVNTSRSNIKDRAIIDTAKKPGTTTEQAKTEQVNPPIKGVGVVVKKNPGGGASRVGTTNEKGEVILTIKETGDYTLILETPKIEGKAENQGGPVKGVKVGLGKNPPGGSTSFATSNNNGEVVFKNLEVGAYKVVVKKAAQSSDAKAKAED
jgi:hypothetical protein